MVWLKWRQIEIDYSSVVVCSYQESADCTCELINYVAYLHRKLSKFE